MGGFGSSFGAGKASGVASAIANGAILQGILTGATGARILMPSGTVGAPPYGFTAGGSDGIYHGGSAVSFAWLGATPMSVNTTAAITGGSIGLTAGGVLSATAGINLDPQTTITSAGGTVTGSDVVVPVNPTGGATAITLTLAAANRLVIIKNITSSTNTITITPSSGTINGAANITMTTGFQVRQIWFDGTNYYTMNS